MTLPPPLSRIVAALPASVPFLAPEAIERRLGRPLAVRLGANESLFGPSPLALAALRDSAERCSLYGDPEAWDLRQALAARHRAGLDNIVLGCGIDELLGLVVQAYLDPGETVVMSTGGYPTFAYHVAGHGGRIATVPYRDFFNDPMALADLAQREEAKLVYLSNPDNPTGTWLPAAAISALLAALPPRCLLLLDEAYAEFLETSAIPEIAIDDPRVIRFRTFSKAHGLAGLRVGYVFGAPAVVRPLDRIRNQFGVGVVAQSAALASLADTTHVETVVAAVAEGRVDYVRLAEDQGFTALPSATNFVAIDMGTASRAKSLLQRLIEDDGVFIRMPGVAPLDRCIRVTIGPPAARAIFAAAFVRALARI